MRKWDREHPDERRRIGREWMRRFRAATRTLGRAIGEIACLCAGCGCPMPPPPRLGHPYRTTCGPVCRVAVWRALNPAQRLAQVHRRRSRLNGEFTPTEWNALLAEYDYSCGYCRSRENITVDHRTPISRGGTNTIANLIPACLSCNSRKSDRTEDEFRHTMAVDVVAMRPPGNV